METKKSKQANLEKRRLFHFTIGLLLAVSVVFVAFEWKYAETKVIVFEAETPDFTPLIPVQRTEIKPPKPKVLPKVVAIPDDEDPDIDLEFTFNVDINDPVEEYVVADEPEEEEKDEIMIFAEEQPSFPGGLQAFYEYIGKELEYPKQAIRQRVEGKVFVQFVVNKDGSLTDIKVAKGIRAGCDEEAIRVLKAVPNWNPGKQRGKPVRVQMMIPITFRLQ
uniref:Energy transducer TonB n=1 Tax=Roseihalotalea indica TaxID=2867963 RepID=A0AA49GK23_9BACT|nr:energy transducer TonB [Tunicatimonas sp. TK19036]